ncbi:23S ribosomal RNA methyltransferase Erm [[Mycobacterium] burgundiense]|uniref:23S ribosomal RNA methyltransferase Erm n=1 Tax=[Mycobacterium] burgundiense TaxID=3064286 RepID=A0ABM9M4R0_9MYCO|nr:23S ribosomal RNA methyltransferase Erm [Mycolicibacterium sp. MU0053]CAJ1510134.1 23S ribosomal RNA methyltransferase Erm [Mycolicibacterium sp. MU0053]
MPTYRGGRHEYGQNFLNDAATVRAIVQTVAATRGPIVEIGPGRGALTFDLQRLRRSLTVVEIDPRHARWLEQKVKPHVRVINTDFIRWQLPEHPHVLVGNLPFHQTTAMLRKTLHAPGWTDAVLLVQWEVARRRAGIGGASMMTAQWWPWVDFTVGQRVPASAFTPRPSVDAGLLVMSRRPDPLLHWNEHRRYRSFVHAVFTGRGRGLPAILTKVCEKRTHTPIRAWLAAHRLSNSALPKQLSAAQWAQLFLIATRR